MGLRKIPPVVQPAQLLEAVVVGLTGEIIQRITEEVDIAPLPGGIGQHLGEGFFEPRMIVGDDELSSSVMAFTFRVETPCTYISAKAATNAFSERW